MEHRVKAIQENDTIQVEVTNCCHNRCSNCTRFVGLAKPFTMDFETFSKAVDSMAGFPHMTGIMGGEPLLHPEFERLCDYALSKIPREQLGLWTCLPRGGEKHREVICRTFGNIFINDHGRGDIYHHPFLVAARDAIPDAAALFNVADRCFFQRAWSASINPRGAYFCEMAASLATLYPDKPSGWPAEPGWWQRTPKDYTSQVEEFCPWCGGALFLGRRPSVEDELYDASRSSYQRLVDQGVGAEKLRLLDKVEMIGEEEQQPLAAYKDQYYRDKIAARYGIYLTVNAQCFNEPHLLRDVLAPGTILDRLTKRYQVG
jgi:hypothetical protein